MVDRELEIVTASLTDQEAENKRLRAQLAEERSERRRVVEADDFRYRDLEAKFEKAVEIIKSSYKSNGEMWLHDALIELGVQEAEIDYWRDPDAPED